ncbi:hypothetical protein [Streptomyces sp. NPDC047000]|uniref:hypothetical protein n=1 Tax=Streptomyces sp. NPDC047000 TaxID=3155474 RepID=UPI0033D59BC9
MPWEELRDDLTRLKAGVAVEEPLWRVTGPNAVAFQAHPAFLDSLRTAGDLDSLLTDDAGAIRTAKRLRITLDSELAGVTDIRTALRLDARRYTDTPAQIALLAYHGTARNQGIVLGSPGILADATGFADRHQPASVQEFVQLHGVYIAAAQALGQPYDPQQHPQRIDGLRGLAGATPSAASARPLALGTRSDWQTHRPEFAKTVQSRAQDLNFVASHALISHVFKHLVLGSASPPNDAQGMNLLVDAYLAEARAVLTAVPADTVTSMLGQTGATRTYYFRKPDGATSMIAVDPSGSAWISTYFAPTRV